MHGLGAMHGLQQRIHVEKRLVRSDADVCRGRIRELFGELRVVFDNYGESL